MPRIAGSTTRVRLAVALLAASSVALVGCGDATPEAAPAAPKTSTIVAAPAPTNPTSAASTVSIVPLAPITTSATEAWLLTLQPTLARIDADNTRIDAAANNGDSPGAACGSLSADVAAFGAAAPAPQAAARALVAQALQAYEAAAASCVAGDIGATTAGLGQAAAYLQSITY